MNIFDTYIKKIEADLRGGKATEYTYRSTLEQLLESLEKGIDASSDPKHIACGAPDFIVERGQIPLGYVETKDIRDDLDRVEQSDQLKRYRQSLNNLILTNYLEFRWYVNGTNKLRAKIAHLGAGNKLVLDSEGFGSATQLFQEFYRTEVPTVGTPKELAERMAQITKLVRDLIINALKEEEEEGESGALHKQYKTFQQFLLPTLKTQEFADIYAQTMAYGLFAACLSAPENAPFNRTAAYQYLTENRFLRRLFLDVGEELDGTIIAPFLDDLASLLAHADIQAILKDFGKRTRTEDPVVHFYETFLAAYNPKLRESRGVYYTPEPVAQFIVNSVDWLLSNKFKRPAGLADPNVHLLDPATGTGTFLYFVIRKIYDNLMVRNQGGTWQEFAHRKLLPRIFGFELLMAPYVISHLKLDLLLKDLKFSWTKDDRLKVYLTNTLDLGITQAETLGDLGWYISQEASEAAEVKKNIPIMVVLGNPPYSNYGMLNKNDWILSLLDDYKQDLKEKKINLDDDYIKFIRFGQWRIERTGQGILAFITNNSFIDGITHRQMRKSLMDTFTDIYILDLHGNSKKQEKSPDGSRDFNVFDIQQGVSINIFVKEPSKKGPAVVHHAELWGSRAHKYEILSSTDIASTSWSDLKDIERESCLGKFRFFNPKGYRNIDEYCLSWSLKDIFISEQNGLKTDRDDLFFDFDHKELEKRMKVFYSESGLEPAFREKYRIENSSSYDLLTKRKRSSFDAKNVQKCLYRPFDNLWLYYSPKITSRPAWEVMRHMLAGHNLGLITTRQATEDWDCFVTESLCGHKSCAAYDINTLFPLYLYTTPEDTTGTLFAQSEITRKPNLEPAFTNLFSKKLGLKYVLDGPGDLENTFGPEDLFWYAYSIFHSPTYRERYGEFLKIDFPRLPLISNKQLFQRLVNMGISLVNLHLLKASSVDMFITSFPEEGNNRVDRVIYKSAKVWINETQFFGGIQNNLWVFKIGGYQILDKWLKDRKGRLLSSDDIDHYQKMVVAIHETIRLIAKIENSITKWPVI